MTVDTTNQEINWISQAELTVKGFKQIIESFNGIPPHDFDFWYKYSKFGIHALDKMEIMRKEERVFVPHGITKDNWDEILPVLEKYFLTYEEVAQIIRNIYHMENKRQDKVKEDPMFMILQLYSNLNGSTSVTELLNMEYKTFFKLYMYSIGNNVLSKREVKNTGDYI